MTEPSGDDEYLHGHHESVLRSHSWRTAENSAGHLLPHLTPTDRLLDVGCGPGTISVDLARRVGEVVAFDSAADIVAQAQQLLDGDNAPTNCRFVVGDVYGIDAPDESFDVVHAHQVLQHLTRPDAALAEMHRVLRPGGILAVRDADYGRKTWTPPNPRLQQFNDLYRAVARHIGNEPDAGRHLEAWVHEAGFESVHYTVGVWDFRTVADTTWWGTLWADRTQSSAFADHALGSGLADGRLLQELADGWREWVTHPEATFQCPNGEVIARRAG